MILLVARKVRIQLKIILLRIRLWMEFPFMIVLGSLIGLKSLVKLMRGTVIVVLLISRL